MANESQPPATASLRHRLSQRPQQQQMTNALRAEYRARSRAKMERVTAWVAECAASREQQRQHQHQHRDGEGLNSSSSRSRSSNSSGSASSVALLLEECDGETEDLLLQVLIARPKYEGIPSSEEIQRFAGQLRAYHARLWTLGMTRGFFRPDAAAAASSSSSSSSGELLGWGNAPDYPEDIDSLESMSMQEEIEGQNWMVHGKKVFVRKISPAEEELRDEMIQEYHNIRRHSVDDRMMQERFRASTASVNTMMTATTASEFRGTDKENRAPGRAYRERSGSKVK
ncbi:unnamed protein product [Discula destructiva]